jgi:hypothetical protein
MTAYRYFSTITDPAERLHELRHYRDFAEDYGQHSRVRELDQQIKEAEKQQAPHSEQLAGPTAEQ